MGAGTKMDKNNPLTLFHPLIGEWFLEKVGTPTDIQERAWPQVAEGRHVLVTAPTGSGKTLTAFLWAINQILEAQHPPGMGRVLYISPLKALNNDIRRNLTGPLEELQAFFAERGREFPQIRVGVRSGDTDPSERRKMVRHPPEIFITTPESLNILLSSKSGLRLLRGISTVILDEIHALVPGKRGTYLSTAVERLVPLCGEFQRVALSATVHPLDVVADFVGGFEVSGHDGHYEYKKRKVQIVKSDIKKQYEIAVRFPETAKDPGKVKEWWPSITQSFKEVIGGNRSTLFFANSRRMVEKVTRFINSGESQDRAYSHHGSLSREIREVVEKRFKAGELPAIIATSSLELGIDIGSVDQVVMIQPPYTVAAAIQRIGRAGHSVGQVSRGLFYPLHRRAFIDAAVIASLVQEGEIEITLPVMAPLDVLAQVILSMTLLEERNPDELYGEIRACYAYARLPREEFDLVIEMLAGRYADSRIRELKPRLLVDRVKNVVKARGHASMLLFLSGGVIPDRGYYNLRVGETKARIGELDEEFVWERSLGEAFPFGNQVWRIQRITANDVEVTQVGSANSVIPFWRAEDMNRSYFLSEKIGEFLEEADGELASRGFREKLTETFRMSETAAQQLLDFLKTQQQETRASLPHRHHLLVEHFRDPANQGDAKQTVLHTLWGGRVNRPLAYALAAAWEEKYHYPLEVFVNNDCIMLNLPHELTFAHIQELVKPGQVGKLLRNKLESTGFFGGRFRENAQRALLLPRQSFNKRMPLWLNRLRSKKLLEAVSQYRDFPILIETWRECISREFEVDLLDRLLEEIESGDIRVTEVVTQKPSPFSDGVIWRQTNKLMYQDDSPQSKLRSKLGDSYIKEVLYSSGLRPRFSRESINRLQDKLHRLAPGYSPGSAEELLQWVRERLYIPAPEWQALLAAVSRDQEESGEWPAEVADRLVEHKVRGKLKGILALENLPRVGRALAIEHKKLEVTARELGLADLLNNGRDEVLTSFLDEWMRFYGPVSRDFVMSALSGDEALAQALDAQLAEGRLLEDCFREESEVVELCDLENLEILIRMRRAAERPDFRPLEQEDLPLFLAAYQHLTAPGQDMEEMQAGLENLFGYPARAGLWESDILPARLSPYYTHWLDSAMRESELTWFGCGNERLGFCFESDFELFNQYREGSKEEPELSSQARVTEKILAGTRGRLTFADLVRESKLTGEKLNRGLWELAWLGRVTNDDFQTLRKGVMNRFKVEAVPQAGGTRRRPGFSRWKNSRPFTGSWYGLEEQAPAEQDALERQELVKDRIRQLFSRYGILFREILWNELPGLRWADIFPALRIMELSGEIFTGHFFKGIPGLQFCTARALRLLNSGLPGDAVFWMNAADPASLCGVSLDGLKQSLPHRLQTTHLVFKGSKNVLVSKKNGKELTIHVEPGDPEMGEYMAFFKVLVERKFQPLKHIAVEKINGQAVNESPYRKDLVDFGFQRDYKALILEKSYQGW